MFALQIDIIIIGSEYKRTKKNHKLTYRFPSLDFSCLETVAIRVRREQNDNFLQTDNHLIESVYTD